MKRLAALGCISALPVFSGCLNPPAVQTALTPPSQPSSSVEPRAAASLSSDERPIADAVDASSDSDQALWERIVNINSGTMNPDGVRQVGAVLRQELDGLGFQTRWIAMDQVHRAGHLVATHGGRQGKRVLLIGHLDTVFERDSPFQQFVRSGQTVTGPGVNDMKGGLVVILSALKALKRAGALDSANVSVFLTGDEEKPGQPLSISHGDLIEAGKQSDVTLCFEPTIRRDGRDLATVSRRGSTFWTLDVSAQGGHSGLIFSDRLGSGAIFEAARILDAFHTELREPMLTYSVGLLLGGTHVELDAANDSGSAMGKVNVVPERAMARGDLRALTPEQVAHTEDKMRAIVARHLPRADAKISFEDAYPPMAPTPGNRALLARLNEVNGALGEPAEIEADPMMRGAGDISFVAPFVDSLSGLGMSGQGAHAPGENADASRLSVLAKRAALFIYRLTRAQPGAAQR
jgi:glutamate carboxypeptidase